MNKATLGTSPAEQRVRFSIHVRPRAKRPSVGGTYAGSLIVRVGAAPHEGAANDDVVRALAGAFGITPSSVRILQGRRSPRKVVELAMEDADARPILKKLLERETR